MHRVQVSDFIIVIRSVRCRGLTDSLTFRLQYSEGKFTVGNLQIHHDDEGDCKICADGQFWDKSLSACTNCAAGKTGAFYDNFGCVECDPGTFRSR